MVGKYGRRCLASAKLQAGQFRPGLCLATAIASSMQTNHPAFHDCTHADILPTIRRPGPFCSLVSVHERCLTPVILPLSPSTPLLLLSTACPANMATNEAQQVFTPVLAAQHTMMSSADTETKNQAHKFLENFQKSVRIRWYTHHPTSWLTQQFVGRRMDCYVSYVRSQRCER